MNRQELKKQLDYMNVSERKYDLEGATSDQTLSILQNGDKWEVFYCERGAKSVVKLFDTESEACEFMLESLRPAEFSDTLPFLPVGSVVRLEGGNVNLVIIARALLVKDKNGNNVYYDYGALPYPHGLVNGNMAYFHQDAIERVLFVGYVNEQERQIIPVLENFIEQNKDVPRGKRDSLG